jgi:hypothetical protein
MAVPTVVGRMLLIGYVLAFSFANVVAYLISRFYQKKFGQPAPTVGFVVAVVFSLLYGASLIGTWPVPVRPMEAVKTFLLCGCTIGSTWASLALFFTMRRVRK